MGDPNARARRGATALHEACRGGGGGGEMEGGSTSATAKRDHKGAAAKAAACAVAKLLLEAGAPPDAGDAVLRRTAGEAALAAGHPALARLVHAYAGAERRGDWAAGNLRMLFDSAPPEHLREAGGSKWHFL